MAVPAKCPECKHSAETHYFDDDFANGVHDYICATDNCDCQGWRDENGDWWIKSEGQYRKVEI